MCIEELIGFMHFLLGVLLVCLKYAKREMHLPVFKPRHGSVILRKAFSSSISYVVLIK